MARACTPLILSERVGDEPVGGDGHWRINHPERPERIGAVMAGIADLHLGSDLHTVVAVPPGIPQLTRVHTSRHLEALERLSREGGGTIDPDTYATTGSWSTACKAAGAGLAVVRELRERGAGVGFAVVRPPGHHASKTRSSGFCLLNNVAVATAELTDAGERVLIVDWDVHHGNGTEAIFWDDPAVLYVSTHQWPAYPGTGRIADIGGPRALGTTVNLPLPPGATGDVVVKALEEVAWPAIEEFAPTWVLVSAGFDAHRDDPLADLSLSAGDFARLARFVAGCAPRAGRLALILEGGYDWKAIRLSVAASVGELVGSAQASELPTNGGPGAGAVEVMARRREAVLDAAR